MAGRYTNLTFQQLQIGKKYDFEFTEQGFNGQPYARRCKNCTFLETTATHAIFDEPNVGNSDNNFDDEGIMWEVEVPLNIAQTVRYNVASDGETDPESQPSQGGKRRKTLKRKKSRHSFRYKKSKKSMNYKKSKSRTKNRNKNRTKK